MANTADIQVSANSGRTTQELHRDALQERRGYTQEFKTPKKGKDYCLALLLYFKLNFTLPYIQNLLFYLSLSSMEPSVFQFNQCEILSVILT